MSIDYRVKFSERSTVKLLFRREKQQTTNFGKISKFYIMYVINCSEISYCKLLKTVYTRGSSVGVLVLLFVKVVWETVSKGYRKTLGT